MSKEGKTETNARAAASKSVASYLRRIIANRKSWTQTRRMEWSGMQYYTMSVLRVRVQTLNYICNETMWFAVIWKTVENFVARNAHEWPPHKKTRNYVYSKTTDKGQGKVNRDRCLCVLHFNSMMFSFSNERRERNCSV